MSADTIKNILTRWAAGDVGALTGSTAPLIENDLRAAAQTLSNSNWATLPAILNWMHEELPADCWGSREKRLAWAGRHVVAENWQGTAKAIEAIPDNS